MPPFVNQNFRDAFPEFQDIAKYPDAQINLWSGLAVAMVNCNRWQAQTTMGQYLYVAHKITLAAQNMAAGNIGGTPGGQSGPVNSKTVGSVTVAYDTEQSKVEGADEWNLTSYGKQFIHLARIFGAGSVQL